MRPRRHNANSLIDDLFGRRNDVPPLPSAFSADVVTRRVSAFRRLADADAVALESIGSHGAFWFGSSAAHLIKDGYTGDELKAAIDALVALDEIEKKIEGEEKK